MSPQTGNGPNLYQEAYDDMSVVYEKAMVSNHHHAKEVLNRLTTSAIFEPQSSILDVGSGTGKPIAAHFADNGHDVTGIDYSLGMIECAQRQVPNATFLQVEMTSWEPPNSYDMIIASHSLYNFSVNQLRTMVYKFIRWVKKDGIVIIGIGYNEQDMKERGAQFDHRGWAEGYSESYLGHFFDQVTRGREEAWARLIKETGLEIIDTDRALCSREDGKAPGVQFYFLTRRVQDNDLIGPFPIPDTFSGPIAIQIDAWHELKERLEGGRVKQAISEALREEPSCRKVLYVSKFGNDSQTLDGSGIDIQRVSELPSPSVQLGSVDSVLLNWALHVVSSPGQYLDDAIKAIAPTGHARFIVVQAAPDNELVNLCNTASEGLDLPIQHHGYLLKDAETRLKAAGFQTVDYIRSQGILDFGPAPDGRIERAARVISGFLTGDKVTVAQLEERLHKLLKIHFSFNPSGEIICHTAILVAERN